MSTIKYSPELFQQIRDEHFRRVGILTTSQASEFTGVRTDKIREACREGKIKATLGKDGRWQIPFDGIKAWAASRPSGGRRKEWVKCYVRIPVGQLGAFAAFFKRQGLRAEVDIRYGNTQKSLPNWTRLYDGQ